MTKKTKTEAAASTAMTPIKAIKGFNRDMTCRGFQFAPGEAFEVAGKIKACGTGFHACHEHPLAVFGYYAPSVSRYFDVELSGETDSQGDKIAAARITIGVELTIPDIVSRAVKWVWDHCTLVEGSSATGAQGAASATGYQGAASATGAQGAASATGTQGAASATGFEGRVMGAEGNAIFAVEREPFPSCKIISAACGIVGQDGIAPDTWYVCQGGTLVAAS